jgi:hypothetical protein
MSQPRHTADSITDDALDELYANASQGWRRGDRWKARALAAEAALERVHAALEPYDREHVQVPAARLHDAVAEPEETSTP